MEGRRAVGAATIAEAFRLTVEDHPDRIAVRTKDDEIALTWAQLRDSVDALAGGLDALGVTRGDTVALMISNRPEFMVADLAAMTLGATPFSIYLTSAPDQVAYVVKDAGARRSRSSRRRSRRWCAARRARAHASSEMGRRTRASTPSRTGARSSPTTSSR